MSDNWELVEIQNTSSNIFFFGPSHFLEAQPDGTLVTQFSTAEKIESFSGLQLGWDYGVGSIIDKPTIEAAQTWNRVLTVFGFETDASPGADGEIAIAGSCGLHYLEVIVEADQSMSVAYDFKGTQEYYHLHRPTIEVLGSILDVAGEIWSASTWYTQGNTIQSSISGPGLLLGTMAGPYQYLLPTALKNPAARHVNTSGYIGVGTNTSAANLQSFGHSTPTAYPPAGQSGWMVPKRTVISSSKG